MLLNRHLKSQVSWYSDQNDCHSSFPHFVVYSIDFERFKHLKNTSPCQLSPKMCTNSSDMSLSTHSFRMESIQKKTFSINTCLLNKTKKIHVYLKRPLYTTTIATNPWPFVMFRLEGIFKLLSRCQVSFGKMKMIQIWKILWCNAKLQFVLMV